MVSEAYTRQELIDRLLGSDRVIAAVLSLKYRQSITVNGVGYEQIVVNAMWDTGGYFYAGSPFKTLSTEFGGTGTTLKDVKNFDPVTIAFIFYPNEDHENQIKEIMGKVSFKIVDRDRARVEVSVQCYVPLNNFTAIKKALSDSALPIKRMEISHKNIRSADESSIYDLEADVHQFMFETAWTVDPLEYEHLLCPAWWSK